MPTPEPSHGPATIVRKPEPPVRTNLLIRVAFTAAGLALLAGFFLPWVRVAGVAAISGLGLMGSEGAAVEVVAGSHRFLLFAVPLFGVLLMAAGVTGHRAGRWVAVTAGVVVIGGGIATLVVMFFRTTGSGMWLVLFGALAALVTGLLTIQHR
jgi:hypothetical protein